MAYTYWGRKFSNTLCVASSPPGLLVESIRPALRYSHAISAIVFGAFGI